MQLRSGVAVAVVGPAAAVLVRLLARKLSYAVDAAPPHPAKKNKRERQTSHTITFM